MKKLKLFKDKLFKKWHRSRLGTWIRLRRYKDQELETRWQMANASLRYCISKGDPYNAVPIYREQAQRLRAEIARRNRNNPDKPDKTTVQLKAGSIGAKGQGIS